MGTRIDKRGGPRQKSPTVARTKHGGGNGGESARSPPSWPTYRQQHEGQRLTFHERDGRAGRYVRYSLSFFCRENADRSRVNACNDCIVSKS